MGYRALLEHLRQGRVGVSVELVNRGPWWPMGGLVVRPARDDMEMQVRDALASVLARGLEKDGARGPEPASHRSRDALYQGDRRRQRAR